MPSVHFQDRGEMPAGGAIVRRWTLRENRSRYEAEAHAFRRWVLSHEPDLTTSKEETREWNTTKPALGRYKKYLTTPHKI